MSLFATTAAAYSVTLNPLRDVTEGAVIHVGGTTTEERAKIEVFAPGEDEPFYTVSAIRQPNFTYFEDITLPEGITGEFMVRVEDQIVTFNVRAKGESATPKPIVISTVTEMQLEGKPEVETLCVTTLEYDIDGNTTVNDDGNLGLGMIAIIITAIAIAVAAGILLIVKIIKARNRKTMQ